MGKNLKYKTFHFYFATVDIYYEIGYSDLSVYTCATNIADY
jgi:hypothetical protein